MKRVATCVIEVRDGHVTNYGGGYDAYLYSVNKEIEDGERELATRLSKAPPTSKKPPTNKPAASRAPRRDDRAIRKEIAAIERTIARLDEQKKLASSQLLESFDAAESLRLHNEVTALTSQLAEAEDRWCQLQAEMEME